MSSHTFEAPQQSPEHTCDHKAVTDQGLSAAGVPAQVRARSRRPPTRSCTPSRHGTATHSPHGVSTRAHCWPTTPQNQLNEAWAS